MFIHRVPHPDVCPELRQASRPGSRAPTPVCPLPSTPWRHRETSFTLHRAWSSSPLPGRAGAFRGDRGALLGLDFLLAVGSGLFLCPNVDPVLVGVSASRPGCRDSGRRCFNKGENNA